MATAAQTAAFSPAKVELLDLRHFTAPQLRPLLQQEAVVWQQRLRWEYRSSTELLLHYLDSRMLPGFVACFHGQILGYAFYVYEGNKAVIGDVYVDHEIDAGLELAGYLTRHLLEVLDASPDVDRIEAQLLLYDAGKLAEPFTRLGFSNFPRLYEECELDPDAVVTADPLPSGLELCPWAPPFYQPAAELIHAAYAGHLDAQINDQYRTLHGSLRFLHNIVRFPGCGEFDPGASWILRERLSHALAGLLLCSRVAPDVAHMTQLCVAPAYRGRGLGLRLLHHAMQQMRRAPGPGYRAITLTVSEQNLPAVRLYRESGFRTRHRFDAMVLDKRPGHIDLSR
jgi:ribosomal protein S18 acetylase RimI-like enzyme